MVEEQLVELDMLTKATMTAERMEKANTEMKELLKRQEAIAARNILGGQSVATNVEQPREETPKEYTARIMRGGR
jgi:hypothetical protein